MGILISGVVLAGTAADYTDITMVKGSQMVTINLKNPVSNLAYLTATVGVTSVMVSPASGLASLNACTWSTAPIKPNPVTLALVKDILQYSGVSGGSVPEPTVPPNPNPQQLQL